MMLASMGCRRIPATLLNWGRRIHAGGRGRMKSSVADYEAAKRDPAAVRQQLEAAAREDRLDFLTAAKILFSTPAKPKKFGLDFHLWQFFAACLPPFAVYLTAQYARYEMRRLEKEREQAEKLVLQTVVAEEIASRLADEGDKTISQRSDKVASSSTKVPQKEEAPKPKSNDTVVQVSEADLQGMRRRLEILERKLSLLEGVPKETVADTASISQPVPVSKPGSTSASVSTQYTRKKGDQNVISSAELEREQQRRTLS